MKWPLVNYFSVIRLVLDLWLSHVWGASLNGQRHTDRMWGLRNSSASLGNHSQDRPVLLTQLQFTKGNEKSVSYEGIQLREHKSNLWKRKVVLQENADSFFPNSPQFLEHFLPVCPLTQHFGSRGTSWINWTDAGLSHWAWNSGSALSADPTATAPGGLVGIRSKFSFRQLSSSDRRVIHQDSSGPANGLNKCCNACLDKNTSIYVST